MSSHCWKARTSASSLVICKLFALYGPMTAGKFAAKSRRCNRPVLQVHVTFVSHFLASDWSILSFKAFWLAKTEISLSANYLKTHHYLESLSTIGCFLWSSCIICWKGGIIPAFCRNKCSKLSSRILQITVAYTN